LKRLAVLALICAFIFLPRQAFAGICKGPGILAAAYESSDRIPGFAAVHLP